MQVISPVQLIIKVPIIFSPIFILTKSQVEIKIFKSWLICGTIIRKRENLSSLRKNPANNYFETRVSFFEQ